MVNVGSWLAIESSIKKHLADHFWIWLISQLINCISRVLEKLLKFFNDTLFLTSFLPLFPILPASFVLNSNEALLLSAGKSAMAPLYLKKCSSL